MWSDGWGSSGWIDCLFEDDGGEKNKLNQKEKRENHEFLNPIVGFRAVQAAAVAAGFSNVVIEATCRARVRPCTPRACICVSL